MSKIIDLSKARTRRDDAAAALSALLGMAAEAAHDQHLSRARFTRAATIAYLDAGAKSPVVTVAPKVRVYGSEAALAAELDRVLPGQIGQVAVYRTDLWHWRWTLRDDGWQARVARGLPAQASASGDAATQELATRAAIAALRAIATPPWRQRLGHALKRAWDRVRGRR